MSNAAKLKKKAAEFEQKKQFDKALQLYVQILDESDGDEGETDVALYNRVGDLLMRQGTVGEAMTYYEKAVDIYAESGFFNNAIALCNKILRQSPGRNSIYYKLGKISAKKGFISDAKQNFLEYASRMQNAGQLDEAFRSLKEFADLCPDQDDIRLMLAEQLSKEDRQGEALEQLQLLYQRYESEGRAAEMAETLERMRAIDPKAQPRSGGEPQNSKSSELVFLDLSDEAPKARPPEPKTQPSAKPRLAGPPPRPGPGASAPKTQPSASPKQSAGGGRGAAVSVSASEPDEDLLPLSPAEESEPAISGFMSNEPVARAATPAPNRVAGFEPSTLDQDLTRALDEALPELEPPLSGRQFGSLQLSTPLDVPLVLPPEHDLALPGELPRLSGMRDVSISLTGEMDLIIPESDATGMAPPMPQGSGRSGPVQAARGETRAPTRIAPPGGQTGPSKPEARKPAPRPPATGLGRRHNSEPEADFPLLDVNLPSKKGSAPGGPDLELVGGAELLEAPAQTDGEPDAAAAGVAEQAEWNQTPEVEAPPLVEDTSGVGYENRIDLPAWMDGIGEPPAADENGSPPPEWPVPQAVRRPSRPVRTQLARSAESLRTQVDENPDDWSQRRKLAEALLDAGDREGGLHELETAMIGLERGQDLEGARSMADEIIRLNPNSVRHHQKRVEYAFRMNDRARLPETYLELADALFRSGQADKARAVYHRVLELAPQDGRAQAALSTFGEDIPRPITSKSVERASGLGPQAHHAGSAPAARPAASVPSPASKPASASPAPDRPSRKSAQTKRSAANRTSAEQVLPELEETPKSAASDHFVNLGDLVRDEESPRSTRLVVEDEQPTGDEAADFADMLRRFKQGIAENVDDGDHESHYDLGVAYKEMGLVDEAISEFQKALRGPDRHARTFEALGQCFVEKQQYRVAATILSRALSEPGVTDDQLVGVLYLLGYTSEALMQWEAAISYYQRVFAVDIRFRDVSDRLASLERAHR